VTLDLTYSGDRTAGSQLSEYRELHAAAN